MMGGNKRYILHFAVFVFLLGMLPVPDVSAHHRDFTDNFNRADTIGTGSVGSGWAITGNTANTGIVGNELRSNSAFIIHTYSTSSYPYVLHVTLSQIQTNAMLVFRYCSLAKWTAIRAVAEGYQIIERDVSAGIFPLRETLPQPPVAGDVIRVTDNGTTVFVAINGDDVDLSISTTADTVCRGVGVADGQGAMANRYDDFGIEDELVATATRTPVPPTASPTRTPAATNTKLPGSGATNTPIPTVTRTPNATIQPTWTPGATATPYPTFTPIATYTPSPTAGGASPTSTHTPAPTNTPNACSDPRTAGVNLLSNASFEMGTGTAPDDWSQFYSDRAAGGHTGSWFADGFVMYRSSWPVYQDCEYIMGGWGENTGHFYLGPTNDNIYQASTPDAAVAPWSGGDPFNYAEKDFVAHSPGSFQVGCLGDCDDVFFILLTGADTSTPTPTTGTPTATPTEDTYLTPGPTWTPGPTYTTAVQPTQPPTPTDPPEPTPTATSAVLSDCVSAMKYATGLIHEGLNYCWGGNDPNVHVTHPLCPSGYGLDCSGLGIWAYTQAGVDVNDNTAQGMYQKYQHVTGGSLSGVGLKIGDAIVIGRTGPSDIFHVAWYTGGGIWADCFNTVVNCVTHRIDTIAAYVNAPFVGYFRIVLPDCTDANVYVGDDPPTGSNTGDPSDPGPYGGGTGWIPGYEEMLLNPTAGVAGYTETEAEHSLIPEENEGDSYTAGMTAIVYDFGCPININSWGIKVHLCITYTYVKNITVLGIPLELGALIAVMLTMVVLYIIRKR